MPLTPGFILPPTPFRPVDILGSAVKGFAGAAPLVAPTLRYVRKTGSDSNGGTSPADAWLTVNKALTTVSSNTWVYVGAGVYRELQQPTISPTSLVRIIGDVSGWNTGDAGMVAISAYLTSDTTAPSGTTLLNMNGKSNLSFENIVWVPGSGIPITATTVGSRYITFFNCAWLPLYSSVANTTASLTLAQDMPADWLFDSCLFWIWHPSITVPRPSNGDLDINFVVRNCRTSGFAETPSFTVSAGGSGKWGGVKYFNNFWNFVNTNFFSTVANMSTAAPCLIYGCFIPGSASTCFGANVLGQIVEDYNIIGGFSINYSNTTQGPHTKAGGSVSPLFHMGQEDVWGGNRRPFGEPMAASPALAYGGVPYSAMTIMDARRGPRPSLPSRWDVGAYQRGNNFQQETATVHTAANAVSVIGDGFQDFDLAVTAGQVTVSVWCQYDANYAGPLPQMQVVNGDSVGVASVAVSFDTAANTAWEQRSITINPTASGIVTIRFISGDTSGISKVVFDTFSVG